MSIPETIDGYTVIEQIGAGSSSVVFKVRDKKGSEFALKLFHVGLNLTGALKKRFLAEAQTLEKVNSPRTAKLFHVGETDTTMYLLMELVDGESLDQIVEAGPLRGLQLNSALAGLVEALKDTHASGVTHRDLKPENIILGPEGLKLIDFGLSAIEDANASTRSVISGGTPAWLSPEQAIGKDVGPSSDIFSLGLVISFLATGHNPFGRGKPDALIYRIVNEEPNLDGLSGDVRTLVKYCLKKDPAERPTIAQIAEAVSKLSGSQTDSEKTALATETMIASFSESTSGATPKQRPIGKNTRKRVIAVISMVAVTSLATGLALFPAKSDIVVDYQNQVGNNYPIFDSHLLVKFDDKSSRQIDLPSGASLGDLPRSFSEDAGQWRAGENLNLSLSSEIDEWSTEFPAIKFPAFFSLLRVNSPYVVTVVVDEGETQIHGSWGVLSEEPNQSQSLVAAVARVDESDYRRSRVAARSACVREQEDRLERLVGSSLSFSSEYRGDKAKMRDEMPQTLSAESYRSRLYGLSGAMFDRHVGATSPEVNGNASQVSEDIVLSVRELYGAHFDLMDLVEWVGDTMVSQPRGYGFWHEMYSREFAVWGVGEQSLRSAHSRLIEDIEAQAEYVCYPQFPELD